MIWLYGVIHKVSLFSLLKLHRVIITSFDGNVKFFLHFISFFFGGLGMIIAGATLWGLGRERRKFGRWPS